MKFESLIKKPILANHALFTFITFSKISSFAYIFRNTTFIIPNLQKDFHEHNLLFVFLQFYKHNHLNTLANNILFSYASKRSIETTKKDSHSTSSSGTFKPGKLVKNWSPFALILVLYIYHHRLLKHLIQIALYYSNSFWSSIGKDINLLILSPTLNALTYPLILGIIKSNALSNFILIKYLELVF